MPSDADGRAKAAHCRGARQAGHPDPNSDGGGAAYAASIGRAAIDRMGAAAMAISGILLVHVGAGGIVLAIFWAVRVRFTGWYAKTQAAGAAAEVEAQPLPS